MRTGHLCSMSMSRVIPFIFPGMLAIFQRATLSVKNSRYKKGKKKVGKHFGPSTKKTEFMFSRQQ